MGELPACLSSTIWISNLLFRPVEQVLTEYSYVLMVCAQTLLPIEHCKLLADHKGCSGCISS
jgi:hypothetical protein